MLLEEAILVSKSHLASSSLKVSKLRDHVSFFIERKRFNVMLVRKKKKAAFFLRFCIFMP